MALPTPTGTKLYYRTPGSTYYSGTTFNPQDTGEWTEFGCLTSIEYAEDSKTAEPDIINNSTSAWTGQVVTSKTRKVTIEGLFKHTESTGGRIPYNQEGSSADELTTGNVYWLMLEIPDPVSGNPSYDTNFIHFTNDNAVPESDGDNVTRFVVLNRNITFSGTEAVKFSITFGIDAGSLC